MERDRDPAAGAGAQRCRRTRELLGGVALRSARRARSGSRCPARGAKRTPAGGRGAQRRRRVPAAQAAARLRLRRAVAGARRARRPARARAGAAADRVLRHLEPRADRQGRLDGGVRGRAARSARTTGSSRSRASRDRTTSPPWTRCSGAGSRGCSRSRHGRPEERRRRFSYPPALIVVDGGRGQLTPGERGPRRARAVDPAHRPCEAARGGLLPRRPDPLSIPRGSEALFVLQHIRDEAHRFAITYHRQKREKRALHSPLDDIPGVGPAAQEGAAEAVRIADAAARRRPSTSSRRRPGVGPAARRDDLRPAARRRPPTRRVSA